jgi:hypothetical protein
MQCQGREQDLAQSRVEEPEGAVFEISQSEGRWSYRE